MSTPSKPDIVLAAGLRTYQARAGSAFAGENAGHLGASLAREIMARAALDPKELDEVIVGCVGEPHDQANIARVIALRAGIPQEVPAQTVARNCASGMQAIGTAFDAIRAGRGDTFLCMGVEVMSAYPLLFGRAATAFFGRLAKARNLPQKLATLASFRPAMLTPRIALVEGLRDPTCGLLMGSTAEHLARDFGISREAGDAFALESHRRAQAALESGRFAREAMPHLGLGAKAGVSALARDEGIRAEQTLAALAKLGPYFEKPDGVVTVGNACGISDGAAGMIVCTAKRAKQLGLEVLAKLRSVAWAGCEPARMGLGPVFSSAKALEQAGCKLKDMDVVEINEAFAVQVLACAEAFQSDRFAQEHLGRPKALGELDPKRLNPNGGAIALGHPVGATGARMLLTLAHELAVGDHQLGLATLCIGGGQGGAVVLERVSS